MWETFAKIEPRGFEERWRGSVDSLGQSWRAVEGLGHPWTAFRQVRLTPHETPPPADNFKRFQLKITVSVKTVTDAAFAS